MSNTTTTGRVRLEVCVDSVESALAAERGGADRVELCSALLEGGITPSSGAIATARQRLTIDINVMIRPRGGDFLYSDEEHRVMMEDVLMAKRLGVQGVVFGLLHADGQVDRDRTRTLLEEARPLSVTFHRAFDMTRDPFEALDVLVELGVDRVLSSGQESSALAGIDLLRDLVKTGGGAIIIMPGGEIHERNIATILRETGASEIHVTGERTFESPMTFRNPRCFMGGELRPPEYARSQTDPERVRALVRLTR